MSQSRWENLYDAGKTLIEKSGLARYADQEFVACGNESKFSKYWKTTFDPTYGRYMAWILFEVGAENLAKAACLYKKVQVSCKATLHGFLMDGGYFKELGLSTSAFSTLIEGYEELERVRNRDAHSYRRGVRGNDFPLVKDKCVPALNILVKAMKDGGCSLP